VLLAGILNAHPSRRILFDRAPREAGRGLRSWGWRTAARGRVGDFF